MEPDLLHLLGTQLKMRTPPAKINEPAGRYQRLLPALTTPAFKEQVMAESQPILAHAAPQGSVEYRDIYGFPGYRIGNDGSVWTCWERQVGIGAAIGGRIRGCKWTKLKPGQHRKKQYLKVTLTCGGKPKCLLVHRLVLEAFVGPCPPGKQCAHDNGNGSDNRLANLAWKTPKQNGEDRVRHGTNARQAGEKNGWAKLTEKMVSEAKRRYSLGESQYSIAESLGVRQPAISRAISGRRWRHVA